MPIRSAAPRAAFYAAASGERIGISHLHQAAIAETKEMGKLIQEEQDGAIKLYCTYNF